MDFSTLDPYTYRLFQIESNLGQDPRTYSGRNIGLGQFGPDEMRQYGITDPHDPQQQVDAVARERANHSQIYQNRFGGQPSPGQLYLMHQQGVAGGPALMGADPNTPAWQAIRPYYKSDAVAQSAISGNIPKSSPLYGRDPRTITAGDFSNYWINKFNQTPYNPSPAVASLPPSGAPASVAALAPQPVATPGISPDTVAMSTPPPTPVAPPMDLAPAAAADTGVLSGLTGGMGGLGSLGKLAMTALGGNNTIKPAQMQPQPIPQPDMSGAQSLSNAMTALAQTGQQQAQQPAIPAAYRQRIIDAINQQNQDVQI